MGWSKETLESFVPILSAGAATFDEKPAKDEESAKDQSYPPASAFLKTSHKRIQPNTIGLADPDRAVTFLARLSKITLLFNALRPF